MEERLGSTMAQAGAAITVTSGTNFIAFLIGDSSSYYSSTLSLLPPNLLLLLSTSSPGASSSLPALTSFCLFAAVGILAIFLLQVS